MTYYDYIAGKEFAGCNLAASHALHAKCAARARQFHRQAIIMHFAERTGLDILTAARWIDNTASGDLSAHAEMGDAGSLAATHAARYKDWLAAECDRIAGRRGADTFDQGTGESTSSLDRATARVKVRVSRVNGQKQMRFA